MTLQREHSESRDGEHCERDARECDETITPARRGGPRMLEILIGGDVVGVRLAVLLSMGALDRLEILRRVKDAPIIRMLGCGL